MPGAGEAVIRITATTICGTDCTYRPRRIPRSARAHPRRRTRRCDQCDWRLDERGEDPRRPTRHRRRDHAVRAVLLLPERCALAVRLRAGRLALWPHDQRRRAEYPLVPDARANLAPIPRLADRRAGAAVPGHLLDRARRGRSGKIRAGDAVAVFAEGRSGSVRRLARSSRARRSSSASIPWRRVSRRRARSARTSCSSDRDRRRRAHQEATEGRARTWRSRPWAVKRRSKTRFAPSGRAARSRVWASLRKARGADEAIYAGLGDQRIVTALCRATRSACAG